MNGGRYILIPLALLCLLPIAAYLPAAAEQSPPVPYAPTRPVLEPLPEIGFVNALQISLSYVSTHLNRAAPPSQLVWQVELRTPKGLGDPVTWRYEADNWSAEISRSTEAGQPTYDVHLLDAATGFAWQGRVHATGQVESGDTPQD